MSEKEHIHRRFDIEECERAKELKKELMDHIKESESDLDNPEAIFSITDEENERKYLVYILTRWIGNMARDNLGRFLAGYLNEVEKEIPPIEATSMLSICGNVSIRGERSEECEECPLFKDHDALGVPLVCVNPEDDFALELLEQMETER